jgi:hypothetical protein
MRCFRAALTALVLVLLSMLASGTAQAGGPTSVLLVVPGGGQTGSLYYRDADYNSLAALVGAFGDSAATGKADPSGTGHESGAAVTLTWLIHDVQVWRVDRVYVRAPGGPWISSQVDLAGSGSIWDSPAVWHTAMDGRRLTSLLDRLGVNPAHPSAKAAATGGTAATGTSTEPPPSEATQGSTGLLSVGLALGAAITVLVLWCFPRARRVVRRGTAAAHERPSRPGQPT